MNILKKIIIPFVVIIVLAYTILSMYITNIAFQPVRNNFEETPDLYSLNYTNVSFKSEDSKDIDLNGWWIESEKNIGTIIWIHGLDSERSGGEGKLDMMKEIHNLGYSILTFDLRGHGNSGDAPLGLGIREKNDIYGAINFLNKEHNIKKIGLYGISYGGVAVLDAAVNYINEDVEIVGIFSDTPYFSVTELLTKEVSDRTPIPHFVSKLLKFGIIQSGELFQNMNIEDVEESMKRVSEIKFPIIIISCKNDERVPVSHPERVYSYSKNSKYVAFDYCVDHGEAFETNKEDFMKEFENYFKNKF
jgi:dipeptidyl aminopeptidase/acylaminoacyl peptidase